MAEYYDPQTYPKRWNFLEPGTIIDQYKIEQELAHGGFSSVYLAMHISTQERVAIKEYLPRKLAHRTWGDVIIPNSEKTKSLYLKGRARFFKEARVLSKLKHPNIVDVINFFHANGTVYMVMTYNPGITLDKAIKNKKTKITEKQLINVFELLLTGIRKMHGKNVLHLDIKPGNILIRAHDNPLLLDFGAIQKYTSSPKKYRSAVITHGFSPIEQYSKYSQLGPWTDIYSVGASMYFCLSGERPIRASKREANEMLIPAVKAFKRKYPPYLLQAIDWAMQVNPEKRPQSITEFQRALS
ncbi:MAG: serine/threonine protein kinase [Methylococcales bacterium]|nr:serine/threonine protein kinase [Methylococcales bacterium]